MKKVIAAILLAAAFLLIAQNSALAQQNPPSDQPQGLLPATAWSEKTCNEQMNIFSENFEEYIEIIKVPSNLEYRNKILACAIKTGRVQLWMMPYFITFTVQFILTIAGTICVLFIVLGGYYYIFGGLTDDKEKGKNTIKFAIIGFIVVLLAWILVNFVQVQITT